jgi:hypothetical protein
MRQFCLALARFCSAFWIGAAFLFVTTSVTEQVQPSFDAATKDTLALIRFPWYYGTGMTLVAVAFFATRAAPISPKTQSAALLLLMAVFGLMCGDFVFVYRPMRAMLTPPGAGHGAEFTRLHHWSEGLNAAGFLLSTTAAAILCAARADAVARPARDASAR